MYKMLPEEISGAYEEETGKFVVAKPSRINPMDIPGVVVNMHGPFTWC